MPPPPEAVVFDMDGLLLDSERLALEAFLEACRLHGVAATPEGYYGCIGTNAAQTRRVLQSAFGPDFPLAAVQVDWARIHAARIEREPIPLKPGARAALRAVADAGVALALATSTHRAEALRRLAAAGIDGFFPEALLVSGDLLSRGKPDPEPYREAVRRLGLPAARCWAVEDSDNGVRSAWAAGLWVLQIPDLVAPAAGIRALGHPILPSLAQLEALFRQAVNR